MLRSRHGAGGADVLRVALSGDDPAGLERRLHYVSYVSRAAAAVMTAYRAGLADLERLQSAAREKAERLRGVEAASRSDRDKILAERQERRRVFDRAAAEIRKSRREINVLRADEARLARLVEALGRLLSARVERAPQRGASTPALAGVRGKIKLPVQGELTGRFGAPRGAAGTESKGLFIRAAEGQPVRSIGRGRVVFADWMRGFGNMMIVDHGEHYLSIYANNEALLKQVGENVEPGESIATTGSSGGNEETGLYFEMRHLGRAFDPLRWVQTR